jgi:hypothetical protein
MGEDPEDHWRIFDGGDDLQGAGAVRAVVDVDIEDPFEQPGPTDARPAHPARERDRLSARLHALPGSE